MKRIIQSLIVLAAAVAPLLAADIAVFPVQGVNTDKSFVDAFGAVLAIQYAKESGRTVIPPNRASRAVGPDNDLTAAAESLGVSEYIELSAVGLYLSNREKNTVLRDSTIGGSQVMVVVRGSENDDDEKSDQQLLDNSKTIVTATRVDQSGNEIYRVQITLLTYGDIEEGSSRIAQSLARKIPIDQTRDLNNITRREGMGQNKMFAARLKGIKVGGIYPFGHEGYEIAPIGVLGFDMRMEAEKFFLEFGVSARIPSNMEESSSPNYGGPALEIGGDYYFVNNSFCGLYGGLGIIPQFNIAHGFDMNLAPYVQIGIMMPQTSSVRFYVDFRVAQHIMPITTGRSYEYDYYSGSYTTQTDRPTELGVNVGIAW